MLARNFKTAAELGIRDEADHAALIKMLGSFERGEIPSDKFNLDHWDTCIAGWCDRLHGTHFVKRREHERWMGPLFCMSDHSDHLALAQNRLQNFLVTGSCSGGGTG